MSCEGNWAAVTWFAVHACVFFGGGILRGGQCRFALPAASVPRPGSKQLQSAEPPGTIGAPHTGTHADGSADDCHVLVPPHNVTHADASTGGHQGAEAALVGRGTAVPLAPVESPSPQWLGTSNVNSCLKTPPSASTRNLH